MLLITSTPLFSYSASIGKSPSFLPSQNCISGLSCGLVGYWTFDGKDVVNGLVIDKSGNGNHANLSNIATSTFFVPGKIGQGFNFDGTNDALNAGSAAILDNLSAMTLSVWVKLSSYGAGGGGYLINKGDAASGGHGWSLFISQSNGLITFTARYNTTNLLSQGALNTFSLSDMNKWVHIMVTWDGSTNSATGVHIYKNGNEISYSSQVNGSSSYLSDAANNLNIGDGGLISGRQTNGILDDVRIYNRVLSARELSQIYSSGASSKQSSSIPITNATSTCSIGLSCGLVTYWTFDGKDIVNGVVRDKSGSGTFANTANISTSTFYTSGIKGQALKFSANNDYIFSDLGTARSTFTISLWYTPKISNSWAGNQTGFQMGKTTYNESNFYRWYSTGSNPRIQASSNNGGSSAQSTVYSSETRLPYLNTFVYTPTQIDWYINGVLYNSIAPSVGTFDAMRFITLGGTGNANQSVNGVIDEFRVYDRALTVGEIKQLYISNISTKQSSSQNIIQNSSCVSGLSCGLIGYWTFDGKDMVGGIARDGSGNGNNGNLINIATSTFYTTGEIGQALNFDGTNDYISMGDILDLNGGVPFSISTWAMFNDFTNSPSILGKFDGTGNNFAYTLEMGQLFETDGSGLGLMLLDSSSGGYIGRSTSRKIVKGVWYHIVGTYDGGSTSSSVKLYYNGVQVDDTNTQGGTFTTIRNVSTPLTIGSLLSNGNPNYLIKGKIDDVRIYNRVLSQSEVIQLYNTGK